MADIATPSGGPFEELSGVLATVDHNPSASTLRRFGFTILFGLGLIGGLLWYRGGSEPSWWQWSGSSLQVAAAVLWIIGPIILMICLTAPAAGRLIYIGWMTGGVAMGTVMTPVGMTVLFVVLLPVFSLIRLKDPLRRRLGAVGSYWEDPTPHEASLERMRRMF